MSMTTTIGRRGSARAMALAALLGACGGDDGPGDGTLPEGALDLQLSSLNSSDVDDGFLEKDENIGNHTGDPWGEFIDEMTDRCGGDPAAFSVSRGTLSIVDAQGVDGFEELFPRGVDLLFRSTQGSDEDAETVVVASSAAPTGSGPVDLDGVGGRDDLAALHQRLLGGDFHVGVRGSTDLTDQDDFSVDLAMSLEVVAYCE
ncbi:MAG: hypothetical protein HYY06_07460 [Deltaproteobacteria bacterium]|nr:hypothetical protein [Deltaproteobacteria bacterium]